MWIMCGKLLKNVDICSEVSPKALTYNKQKSIKNIISRLICIYVKPPFGMQSGLGLLIDYSCKR